MLKGKVHKYGADVNTDEIIPARYLYLSEGNELAAHCMEDIDKDFFARIFFRNSINIGLPLLECPEAVDDIEKGDIVEVDLAKGAITNTRSGKTYTSKPYPGFMGELIAAGGLIEYTKKEVAKARKN